MKRTGWILILFGVLLKLLMPMLLADPSFELHRDEYLYFEQGQHLDLGYLENPPFIGLLARISYWLGGSFFWIKFWPAFFGALTVVVTTAITRELGGRIFAQLIAILGVLFSAYLRIDFLFQPNFLDIFFWTLSAYYLIRYINSKQERYFFLLAIALAFGWWSKYSVLFFASAIFLSLVSTQYRSILKNKNFLLALLMGFILVLPNLIWQYTHRWPLIHHMNELRETQLRYINPMDFIKDQLLMLLSVVFVWIGGLIWFLRQQKFRVVGFVYLFVALLLMAGSGKGYYALGAYPMLIAAGSVWLQNRAEKRIWLRPATIVLILILSIPLVPILLPMQSPVKMAAFNKKYRLEKLGILKWEDQRVHPLQQDFADMVGWKELSEKTKAFYEQLPDSAKTETIVYCRNYGLAASLKYFIKDKQLSEKVISDNGSFLMWIPDRLWFRHLIFVGKEMPGSDDAVFQHFQSVRTVDSCSNKLSREFGTKIIFFENASDSAVLLARKGLNEMKSQFRN
jgi:hypothetical protein